MSRPRSLALGGVLFALAGISATSFHARTTPSATTRQIIAVYLGTEGTDAGMVTIVRDMKAALSHQTAATNREFIARGVSLDPSVDGGIRHLALLGPLMKSPSAVTGQTQPSSGISAAISGRLARQPFLNSCCSSAT